MCTHQCLNELRMYAMYEARKYKWSKSQEAGKDLGYEVLAEWFHKEFYHWYRDRLLEHLEGVHYWREFGDKDFDLHHKGFHPNKKLVDRIFANLMEHKRNISENCGIIFQTPKQELPETLDILHRLDINNKREDIPDECLKCMDKAFQEADIYKWIESQKEGKDLGETAISKWFDKNWSKWVEVHHVQ